MLILVCSCVCLSFYCCLILHNNYYQWQKMRYQKCIWKELFPMAAMEKGCIHSVWSLLGITRQVDDTQFNDKCDISKKCAWLIPIYEAYAKIIDTLLMFITIKIHVLLYWIFGLLDISIWWTWWYIIWHLMENKVSRLLSKIPKNLH